MPDKEPNKHPGPGPHMGGSHGSFSSSGSYGPGPYSQRGPYSQPNSYSTHRKTQEAEAQQASEEENNQDRPPAQMKAQESEKTARDFDSDEKQRMNMRKQSPGEESSDDKNRIPPGQEW